MSEEHSNNSALTKHMIFNKTRANSLQDVRTLNMWGYNLKDVSIFESMPNIEILSLSMNEISTLKYFSSCLKLKELLLRHNAISSISEINYLVNIKSLRRLWLAENPIAEQENYRNYIISNLPQLEILDEQPISYEERIQTKNKEPISLQKLSIEDQKTFHRSRLLSEKVVNSTNYLNPAPTNRRKHRLLYRNKINTSFSNQNIDHNENYNYENIQENDVPQKNDDALLAAVLALLPDLSTDSISIVLDTICKLSK